MRTPSDNSPERSGRIRFSCVVPVKGPRPYLAAALASLENQGMGDALEVILQDGDVEPDAGQSDALNRGFAKARGEWLFWLNADDILLPGALKAVSAAIGRHPDADWFAGNMMYLDAVGKVTKCACERGAKFAYAGFPVRVYGPSSFFRRTLFEKSGGFDVRLRYSMDTDLWCRFRKQGAWYRKVPEYLWGFRVHPASRTSDDLIGNTPPEMTREQALIDARYGVARTPGRVWRLKLLRLLDGSYLRAWRDTRRWRKRRVDLPIVVHVSDGWREDNGAANIARMIAGRQSTSGMQVFLKRWTWLQDLRVASEIWVHCGWKPCLWWAVAGALITHSKAKLRWMPEGCYDPVRLAYHSWKKILAGPIERWCLRKVDAVVVTCSAESDWVKCYEPRIKSIELLSPTSIQTAKARAGSERKKFDDQPIHVLYLGRKHPLKGCSYLEQAVASLCNLGYAIELKIVSGEFGPAKEMAWKWADVLCLPTLSENFGLVVAEALERGKFVITTDGAPAWADLKREQGLYLRGFRTGDAATRVRLLREALASLFPQDHRGKALRISLLTACWNSAKTLEAALESVRRQVLPAGVELEHVVIDGASEDGTSAVLARAAEAPVRTGFTFRWLSEPDRGLYDALNKGTARATGAVIGILNADDVLASDDIIARVAAAFASDPDLAATYGDVRFVRGAEGVELMRRAPTVRYCTGRFFRPWMFRFATFPAHPSTFVRRDVFARFGGYSLDYRICADFELMLRLFWKHRLRTRYLSVCTTVMRLGGLSTGGLRSTLEINREDLHALRANGCWSCLPLLYARYFFKAWGFFCKRCPRGAEYGKLIVMNNVAKGSFA